MLSGPDPPLLGCSFYFPGISDADALALLVEGLVRSGARFRGEVLALRAQGARSQLFASPTDLLSADNGVGRIALDLPGLRHYLTDPNVLLLRIGVAGAIGLAQHEVATYSFILPESVGVDTHPLVLWSEGGVFSGPDRRVTKAARKAGRKVYDRFLSLVKILSPAYAAITVEYSLECPMDLRLDSRSYAFRDFFIDGAYIGKSKLGLVRAMFEDVDAYVEVVGDGLYVSCFGAFNPANKDVTGSIAIAKSITVAKLIASVGRTS